MAHKRTHPMPQVTEERQKELKQIAAARKVFGRGTVEHEFAPDDPYEDIRQPIPKTEDEAHDHMELIQIERIRADCYEVCFEMIGPAGLPFRVDTRLQGQPVHIPEGRDPEEYIEGWVDRQIRFRVSVHQREQDKADLVLARTRKQHAMKDRIEERRNEKMGRKTKRVPEGYEALDNRAPAKDAVKGRPFDDGAHVE